MRRLILQWVGKFSDCLPGGGRWGTVLDPDMNKTPYPPPGKEVDLVGK